MSVFKFGFRCDLCGENQPELSGWTSCVECGKDCCEKCATNWDGERTVVTCKQCAKEHAHSLDAWLEAYHESPRREVLIRRVQDAANAVTLLGRVDEHGAQAFLSILKDQDSLARSFKAHQETMDAWDAKYRRKS